MVFDTAVDQPLFWAERKPVQLFKTLFEDLNAQAVVDLTPGSGTAAKAAVELGLSYVGVALNAFHAHWLDGAAGKHALHLIRTTGSPWYHRELVPVIREHFQRLVDDVEMLEKAQDRERERECRVARASPQSKGCDTVYI